MTPFKNPLYETENEILFVPNHKDPDIQHSVPDVTVHSVTFRYLIILFLGGKRPRGGILIPKHC